MADGQQVPSCEFPCCDACREADRCLELSEGGGGSGRGSIGSGAVYKTVDRSARGRDESLVPETESNERAMRRDEPEEGDDEYEAPRDRAVTRGSAPEPSRREPSPHHEVVWDAEQIARDPMLDLAADEAEMRDALAQASFEIAPEFGDLTIEPGIAAMPDPLLDPAGGELGQALASASFTIGPEFGGVTNANALDEPDPLDGALPDVLDPMSPGQEQHPWDPFGELHGEGF